MKQNGSVSEHQVNGTAAVLVIVATAASVNAVASLALGAVLVAVAGVIAIFAVAVGFR